MEDLTIASRRTDDNVRRSMEENIDLQSRLRTLEEDLRLEREWRQSLQDSIVNERTAMAELQQQMEESQDVSNVNLIYIFKRLNQAQHFVFRTIPIWGKNMSVYLKFARIKKRP